ncbi:hypothetical protein OPQ81_003465 [Rhizoctonia solani]|nr:hypothetical protein OPQ81_003465 [Rhizoctonia solani]
MITSRKILIGEPPGEPDRDAARPNHHGRNLPGNKTKAATMQDQSSKTTEKTSTGAEAGNRSGAKAGQDQGRPYGYTYLPLHE